MRRLVAGILLLAAAASADETAPRIALWEEVLRARVDATTGEVAYRSLALHDAGKLADYVASFAGVDPRAMNRDERVAFWINAYNAGVAYGILHGGTPETLAGRARLYHWFPLEIGGDRLTLDDIEGRLGLLARADPRIRLAACNGTRGAPPLAAEPYTGARLDSMLVRAARRFVNDPRWNRIDVPRRSAELSRVFEWYRPEFERVEKTVLAFVSRFVEDPKVAAIVRRKEMRVSFAPYDWTLNAAPGERPR